MGLNLSHRLLRTTAGAIPLVVLGAVVVIQVITPSFNLSLSTLPYAVVGAAIVWRRPRAGVGWALLVFALLWSLTFLGSEVAVAAQAPGIVLLAAWLGEWMWLPALVMVFVVLPIVFPTGSPAGPGWRRTLWLAWAVAGIFVLATWTQTRFSPVDGMVVDNPWGLLPLDDVETVMLPIMAPLLIVGPVAAVRRFKTATGVERQQVRWFMYAALACGALFATNSVLDALGPVATELGWVLTSIALALPPLAIWVAVSRYNLYAIDRLISRTLSYGLLTALLAGLFAGSVFVFGAVVPFEGDLPVAASTLLVAALFNPLRRRIQDVVDRHFNRARYDAQRLVESFAHRLRAEQDLEGIGTGLNEAVVLTMQPRSYSLWLADPLSLSGSPLPPELR